MTEPKQTNSKRELLAKLARRALQATDEFPLSAGQQGLWLHQQRHPNSYAYNIFLSIRFTSSLDVIALHQAFLEVVNRHPALRTRFFVNQGKIIQQVQAELKPSFEIHDVPDWSDGQILEASVRASQKPFDLSQGPLLRIDLFQRSHHESVLLATSHHVALDFWSLALLLQEVNQRYTAATAGKPIALPLPKSTYHDFVRLQQRWEDSPEGDQDRLYWRNQLADAPSLLEIPVDLVRPSEWQSAGASLPIPFDQTCMDKVRLFATNHRVTPSAVLLATLQVFLGRYSGQTDFVIGCPLVGRSDDQFATTIGFFSNAVPLRSQLPRANRFQDLVVHVAENMLDALDHQMLPLASILRDVDPQRDPSRTPLFQFLCSFEQSHLRDEFNYLQFLFPDSPSLRVGNTQMTSFPIDERPCNHDLEWIFVEVEQGYRGMLYYPTSLFLPSSIATMAQRFVELLHQLIDLAAWPIERVPWKDSSSPNSANHNRSSLSPATTIDPNRNPTTAVPVCDPISPVHRWRETWLSQNQTAPSRSILISPSRTWSLRDVLNETKKTAPPFRLDAETAPTNPPPIMPIIEEDGATAIAKALAGLWSHICILPIDLSQMTEAIRDRLSRLQLPALSRFQSPPAYVIFTSGSTGIPKAVCVEQHALENTFIHQTRQTPIGETDRIGMLLSHQFDAGFFWAIFGALSGASIHWPPKREHLDLEVLLDFLIGQQITILPIYPQLLALLVKHPRFKECTSLRHIVCGGASMPTHLPEAVRNKLPVELWNCYGPTEAAVTTTAYHATQHDSRCVMPIGFPIHRMQCFPVDSLRRPLPPTVPGELMISGPGLAHGYLDDPQFTQQAFISSPHSKERAYLTGDWGRVGADGQVYFLGRRDRQVKLRGFRIELEEIDHLLTQHPAIADVATIVHQETDQSQVLIAFVVFRSDGVSSPSHTVPWQGPDSLSEWLASRLPRHKVPQRWHRLEQLPKTPHSKTDEAKLHILASRLHVSSNTTASLWTELEKHIGRFWLQPLSDSSDPTPFDVDQNFFEWGGDSLQAATVATHLTQTLGTRVSSALIFEMLTLRQFVDRLLILFPAAMHSHYGQSLIDDHLAFRHADSTLHSSAHASLLHVYRPARRNDHLFLIHPPGGIVLCYRELANRLPDGWIIGIRSRGLYGQETLPESLEAMASEYADAILEHQAQGPFLLGGWSLGGIFAFEVALQLQQKGHTVSNLVLFDTSLPESTATLVGPHNVAVGQEYGIPFNLDQLAALSPQEQLPWLWRHAEQLGILRADSPDEVIQKTLDELQHLFHHHVQLVQNYSMKQADFSAILIRPQDVPHRSSGDEDRGWSHLVAKTRVIWVPGQHHSMVQSPHVESLAQALLRELSPPKD